VRAAVTQVAYHSHFMVKVLEKAIRWKKSAKKGKSELVGLFVYHTPRSLVVNLEISQ
jgi:hypothetical protein